MFQSFNDAAGYKNNKESSLDFKTLRGTSAANSLLVQASKRMNIVITMKGHPEHPDWIAR